MEDERLVKKVFNSSVAGKRKRGGPKRRWLACVERLLRSRRLGEFTGKILAKDRIAWRRMVWGVS